MAFNPLTNFASQPTSDQTYTGQQAQQLTHPGSVQNPNPTGSWFDQNPLPGAGIGPGANGQIQPGYSGPTDPMNDQFILYQISQLANQPGADPTLRSDPNYWLGKIKDTGGWVNGGEGHDNIGYWTARSKQGAGGGGGAQGGFGSLNFQAPSLDEARNSPGYQFALQQGMRGIESGAASKGTLLTGGTLKALQGFGTGLADQTYGNVFNRALDVNRTNFGHLYDFATLGVNAAGSAAS